MDEHTCLNADLSSLSIGCTTRTGVTSTSSDDSSKSCPNLPREIWDRIFYYTRSTACDYTIYGKGKKNSSPGPQIPKQAWLHSLATISRKIRPAARANAFRVVHLSSVSQTRRLLELLVSSEGGERPDPLAPKIKQINVSFPWRPRLPIAGTNWDETDWLATFVPLLQRCSEVEELLIALSGLPDQLRLGIKNANPGQLQMVAPRFVPTSHYFCEPFDKLRCLCIVGTDVLPSLEAFIQLLVRNQGLTSLVVDPYELDPETPERSWTLEDDRKTAAAVAPHVLPQFTAVRIYFRIDTLVALSLLSNSRNSLRSLALSDPGIRGPDMHGPWNDFLEDVGPHLTTLRLLGDSRFSEAHIAAMSDPSGPGGFVDESLRHCTSLQNLEIRGYGLLTPRGLRNIYVEDLTLQTFTSSDPVTTALEQNVLHPPSKLFFGLLPGAAFDPDQQEQQGTAFWKACKDLRVRCFGLGNVSGKLSTTEFWGSRYDLI